MQFILATDSSQIPHALPQILWKSRAAFADGISVDRLIPVVAFSQTSQLVPDFPRHCALRQLLCLPV